MLLWLNSKSSQWPSKGPKYENYYCTDLLKKSLTALTSLSRLRRAVAMSFLSRIHQIARWAAGGWRHVQSMVTRRKRHLSILKWQRPVGNQVVRRNMAFGCRRTASKEPDNPAVIDNGTAVWLHFWCRGDQRKPFYTHQFGTGESDKRRTWWGIKHIVLGLRWQSYERCLAV